MSVNPDTEALQSAKIEYLGLQLADENTQEISPTFSMSGEWIHKALEQPSSKVLVNCWAGCSRSATIAIAFLVRLCQAPSLFSFPPSLYVSFFSSLLDRSGLQSCHSQPLCVFLSLQFFSFALIIPSVLLRDYQQYMNYIH